MWQSVTVQQSGMIQDHVRVSRLGYGRLEWVQLGTDWLGRVTVRRVMWQSVTVQRSGMIQDHVRVSRLGYCSKTVLSYCHH